MIAPAELQALEIASDMSEAWLRRRRNKVKNKQITQQQYVQMLRDQIHAPVAPLLGLPGLGPGLAALDLAPIPGPGLAAPGLGDAAVPIVNPGVGLDAIHNLVAVNPHPAFDRPKRRRVSERRESSGLYWESHKVWRKWLSRYLRKKKKKKKSDESDESDESDDDSEETRLVGSGIPEGFYYESKKHWHRWLNERHEDERYRPRVMLHH